MNIDTARERDGGRASPPASMAVNERRDGEEGRSGPDSVRGLQNVNKTKQDGQTPADLYFQLSSAQYPPSLVLNHTGVEDDPADLIRRRALAPVGQLVASGDAANANTSDISWINIPDIVRRRSQRACSICPHSRGGETSARQPAVALLS